MSNENRVVNKDEKVGRKRYLKGLVAGFLGAAAFLKLTDIPKVNAATIEGAGADKQIAYFTGTNTIASSSSLLWDESGKVFTAGTLEWDDADKMLTTTNLTWDDDDRNFIGGSEHNEVTASVVGATISGGGDSGNVNKVTDNYGTIGGGVKNQAGDNSGTTGDNPYATVGGGSYNTASGGNSTVGGGDNNTASALGSTVSGGYDNTASGVTSTVGGGHLNTAAGNYSFAAGRRAKVSVAHPGTFLFADHNDFDFNSIGGNRFDVRCTGGARFVTAIDGAGNPTKQVTFGPDWLLTVGGKSKFGGWIIPTMDNKYKLGYGKKRWKEVWAANGTIQTSLSKFKENIEQPSDIDYLSTVPEPIYFNWKDGDDKQRHLGFIGDHLPDVAKEGDGGVYTSSVTAILCGAVKQLREENRQIRDENEELRRRIEKLEENN